MSNEIQTRFEQEHNYDVDILRFVFCIGIICLHYSKAIFGRQIFDGANTGVEFFFMLSGYYLNKYIWNLRDMGRSEDSVALATRYVYRRVFKVLPTVLFVTPFWVCTQHLCIELGIFSFSNEQQVINWSLGLLFAQSSGLVIDPSSVDWFLSALFLGMLIIAPLLASRMGCVINSWLPIIALLGYSFLRNRYHMVQCDVAIMYDGIFLVLPVLIRAIAGLCLGAFAYNVTQGGCVANRFDQRLINIFKIAIVIGVLTIYQEHSFSDWDFFVVMLLFILLILVQAKPQKFSSFLKNKIVFLGKLSLPLYICQSCCGNGIYLFDYYYPQATHLLKAILFLTTLSLMVGVSYCLQQKLLVKEVSV